MNKGTFVIYSITATGREEALTNRLVEAGVPSSMIVKEGNSLTIPRMTTYWRGDAEEKAWQEALRQKIHDSDPSASVVIEAREWTPAPGYPQGDLSL